MVRVDSFEDLSRFLREFRNFGDPQGPYDFGGVVALLSALLDNLRAQALATELEDIEDRLEPEQISFLKQTASSLSV